MGWADHHMNILSCEGATEGGWNNMFAWAGPKNTLLSQQDFQHCQVDTGPITDNELHMKPKALELSHAIHNTCLHEFGLGNKIKGKHMT